MAQELGTLQVPPEVGAAGLPREISEAVASGRLDLAREKIQQLLKEQPASYEGHYWAGMLEMARGEHHAAVRAFRRAEAIQPNAAVLKGLGLAYYMARQYRLFELKMKEAAAKDPADYAPHYFLGRYQDESSHFAKSAEYFAKALELNPQHFPSHYYLGYSFEARHDIEKAEKYYKQCLEVSQKGGKAFHLAYLGLARLRASSGEHAAALPLAEEAARLKPNDAAVFKFLGSALSALGRVREAIQAWETAARLDPADGQVYYQMSQAHRKAGDDQKADADLAQFKRIISAYGN